MPYASIHQKREYQRRWVKSKRQAWLNQNGPCVICGSWQDLVVDHTNRSEKTTRRIWSYSACNRGKELRKCQVLCSSCHKAKSTRECCQALGRLTDDQVREIRTNHSRKTDRAFAEEFGVNSSTIGRARRGQSYKHVKLEAREAA